VYLLHGGGGSRLLSPKRIKMKPIAIVCDDDGKKLRRR
jgi:hypothetical protein